MVLLLLLNCVTLGRLYNLVTLGFLLYDIPGETPW